MKMFGEKKEKFHINCFTINITNDHINGCMHIENNHINTFEMI